MALSNWDTFAVNEKGEPCGGELVLPSGLSVAIYKNWLYVRDPAGWSEGCGYVKDTVMQIDQADLHYKNVRIVAVRGPKQGVYVVATWDHRHYDETPEGKFVPDKSKDEFKALIGCGVYGFEGSKFVGVEPAELDFLREFVSEVEDSRLTAIPLTQGQRYNQGDAYFAKHAAKSGVDLVATEAGKASTPLLLKMLGNE